MKSKLVIILFLLWFDSVSPLVDGDLDPTFGTGGIATIAGSSFGAADNICGRSIVVQQDGKIVVCVWESGIGSTVYLVRLTTVGALDTTFNSGGPDPGSINVSATAADLKKVGGMVLDSQDNIIVVGQVQTGGDDTQLLVARYIGTGVSAGTLDTTFNAGGVTPGVLPVGVTVRQGVDCTIDSQGRILVTATNGVGAAIYVVRILSNGTLDGTFGVGGIVTIPLAGAYRPFAAAIKVTTNDTVVVSGTGATGNDEAIVIYQLSSADGSLIAPFNPLSSNFVAPPAIYTTVNSSYTSISLGKGLVISSNGNLYVYGSATIRVGSASMFFLESWQSYFGVLGFTSAGALNSSFGNQGQLFTGLAPANNLLPSSDTQVNLISTYRTPYTGRLLQLTDGKFIAVGYDTVNIGFIVRLTSAGALDTTFNGSSTPLPGVIPTTLTNTDNPIFYLDAAVQSDGYILATGGTGDASPEGPPNPIDLIVARYVNSGETPTPPTPPTPTSASCSLIHTQLNSVGGGLSCAIIKKYAALGSAAAACPCTPAPNSVNSHCSS